MVAAIRQTDVFSMHYCLKNPRDEVVGFALDADDLGHEIYRLLDWADAHFEDYAVDQSDGRVLVRSDAAGDVSDLRSTPLSLDDREAVSNPSRGGDDGGGEAEPVGM